MKNIVEELVMMLGMDSAKMMTDAASERQTKDGEKSLLLE